MSWLPTTLSGTVPCLRAAMTKRLMMLMPELLRNFKLLKSMVKRLPSGVLLRACCIKSLIGSYSSEVRKPHGAVEFDAFGAVVVGDGVFFTVNGFYAHFSFFSLFNRRERGGRGVFLRWRSLRVGLFFISGEA